jgi:hypothetical protein
MIYKPEIVSLNKKERNKNHNISEADRVQKLSNKKRITQINKPLKTLQCFRMLRIYCKAIAIYTSGTRPQSDSFSGEDVNP